MAYSTERTLKEQEKTLREKEQRLKEQAIAKQAEEKKVREQKEQQLLQAFTKMVDSGMDPDQPRELLGLPSTSNFIISFFVGRQMKLRIHGLRTKRSLDTLT
jgi:hypothetical protein